MDLSVTSVCTSSSRIDLKFRFILYVLLALSGALGSQAQAAKDCKRVRFADVGWTDITATTAVASEILAALGYEAKTSQLSVPVTYVSLKNKDLDVFLGNWMPSMAADIAPYQKDGSVETVGTVLKGARYTLAVPDFVKSQGIESLSQLGSHKEQFDGKIYGLESGNDGNRLIQKMIDENAFGLKGWKLVESSEQAMLMQVMQAVKRKKWVAFLAWEPHPMNQKMSIWYLKGADGYFGPNQGSSTVHINTRKNYQQECPDVAQFLKNFAMTVESEGALMGLILDQGMEPRVAAKKWMKSNMEKVKTWLAQVKSVDGQDGFQTVSKKLQTLQ